MLRISWGSSVQGKHIRVVLPRNIILGLLQPLIIQTCLVILSLYLLANTVDLPPKEPYIRLDFLY